MAEAEDDDQAAQAAEAAEEAEEAKQPLIKKTYRVFCVQTPKAVYLILGNELCERFAYYGMRAVLVLYLREELKLGEYVSKLVYHTFVFGNYFFCIVGGVVADALTGRYNMIWPGSVAYSFGMTIIAISSVPTLDVNHAVMLFVGLCIVAIAGGAIKPSVVAFAGDQFAKNRAKARQRFFAVFYFCINLGAMLSMILSPIFRTEVSCIENYETCYPLAYGVPAILMFIAVVLFLAGTPLYIRYAAQGSAVLKCVKCIGHAVVMKIKLREIKPRRAHWMDYADDKYDEETISDVKAVLGIFLIFTTLPLFWTLFDQQGSTWTLQSSRMYGMVGSWRIKPDQMDSINAILVMVLIPLVFGVVYPLFAKVGLLKRPLQRMGVGLFIAVSSFVIGGILYLIMEAEYPHNPEKEKTDMFFYNAVPCNVKLAFADRGPLELNSFSSLTLKDIPSGVLNGKVTVSDPTICPFADLELSVKTKSEKAYGLLFYVTEKSGTRQMTFSMSNEDRRRDFDTNKPKVRIVIGSDEVDPNKMVIHRNTKVTNCLLQPDMVYAANFEHGVYTLLGSDNIEEEFCFGQNDPKKKCEKTTKCTGPVLHKEVYWRGGIYTLILVDDLTSPKAFSTMTAQPDKIHILFQLPQYFLITSAEVMVSVTAYSFAYEESPQSMKSVCQAAELVTVALGNLFIMAFDPAIMKAVDPNSDTTSNTLFLYAGIVLLDSFLFVYLAWRYTYKNENYKKP